MQYLHHIAPRNVAMADKRLIPTREKGSEIQWTTIMEKPIAA
jgi:hypothetical protein